METNNTSVNDWSESYENCGLCPRKCGVNRIRTLDESRAGFCGETDQLRVAYIGPHYGEEPPITGERGSGTIFFTGCTLKCTFCQNFQISNEGVGKYVAMKSFVERIEEMIRIHRVHNVNFVTPDHFFPHIFKLVQHIRKRDFYLPFVYNLSGYQSKGVLRMADNFADIYIPDYKYSDSSLAAKLSKCRDYPNVALDAIGEMIRQKGCLDACSTGAEVATKGVLVRHMILPGYVENSLNAITNLFLEFGRELPVSIMSQYCPVIHQNDRELNRFLSLEEFDKVYAHARELGFRHLFIQFPEKHKNPLKDSPFLPDFRKEMPFRSAGDHRLKETGLLA